MLNNNTQKLTSEQVQGLYDDLISKLKHIYFEDFKVTFLDGSMVPDTQRGCITIENQKNFVYQSTENPQQNNGAPKFNDKKCDDDLQKSIVLLIESPHKSEYAKEQYRNRKLKPIFPAQGRTGNCIDDFLTQVLQHITQKQSDTKMIQFCKNAQDLTCNNANKFPLVICNAIQYQTSLDFVRSKNVKKNLQLNETIRDEMFKLLFQRKAIKDDLLHRLCSYKPVWIIDAVTGLTVKKIANDAGLNQQIYDFLIANFNEIPISQCYHPSYWCHWKALNKKNKSGR